MLRNSTSLGVVGNNVSLDLFFSFIWLTSLNTISLGTEEGGGLRNVLASGARKYNWDSFCFHHSSGWPVCLLISGSLKLLNDLLLLLISLLWGWFICPMKFAIHLL